MANWSDLKAAVAEVIKTNNNQEITGTVLQNTLNTIISNVGENATFVGIATPETNPGTPDGNVFYLAAESGTYSNFGGKTLTDDEVAILLLKGSSWNKLNTGLAKVNKITALEKSIYGNLGLFTSRGSITTNADFTKITLGTGTYYVRGINTFRSFTLSSPYDFEKGSASLALVLNSSSQLTVRSITAGNNTVEKDDIVLAAFDNSEGLCKNSILYNYIFEIKIANLQTQITGIGNLYDFLYRNVKAYKKTEKAVTTSSEYIGISPINNIAKGDIIQVCVELTEGTSIKQFRVAALASDGNTNIVELEKSEFRRNFYFKADKAYTGINLIILETDIEAPGTVNAFVLIGDAFYSNDIMTLGKKIQENYDDLDTKIDNIADRVYKEPTIIANITNNVSTSSTSYIDINDIPTEPGDYYINISNDSAVVTSFRMVAYKSEGGNDTLLAHPQPIGEDIKFTISRTYTRFRVIIESNYVTSSGNINITIKSSSYDIAEDITKLQNDVSKNTQDIAELQESGLVHDIMFPVPADIYCAVGVDMNLYYENMFGMLAGTGYMFIDSPNVVYDTSAEESGNNYDKFLNLERQLHFKPNIAGNMDLYLNVWDDYMKQIAAKKTTLHIINTGHMMGKTINLLVNGSSSIDVGTFQSEIKRLLETAGATVNMVGRWASGNNNAGTSYNLKAQNRLSENRSGGASNLYTTKANAGITKIVHPTSITELFFGWNTELQDTAGNHWMVWGNSADFVELVLKSGEVNTIPASGTMTKVAGSGEDTLVYDSLITNVPQTTNPFWNNADNGISFVDYCSNWDRPTPNVFVTLWGTNDIGGSGGNIETGKQWATDAQITTFVERQKVLVDAFTRDCPNGIICLCPQPTGSSVTGIKNSDRNGMLYSKLKATQALMDAFAEYDNVIIVPVQWWFDRKYAYTIKQMTISERMADFYDDTLLDEVTDDSTHPQARGYYQMADAVYSAIVYAFSLE